MLTAKYRQAAIDWLNGKRDFSAGLAILKKSGFKPGVVRRLETIGESETARMHLQENIHLYLRFIGQEPEDTDADLGVIKGKQPEVLKQDENRNLSIDEMAVKVQKGESKVPPNASKAIIMYGKLYRQREKAHRQMAELPETNEAVNVEARRKFSDTIDSCTSQMEKLYPLVSEYLDTKKEISEDSLAEALEAPKDKEKDKGDEDAEADDYDTLPKEELKKRLKSAKTKILRKKNLLEYQQETKAAAPNPLPDCPKRVKYEREIARLEKEVEKLQYAIARKA